MALRAEFDNLNLPQAGKQERTNFICHFLYTSARLGTEKLRLKVWIFLETFLVTKQSLSTLECICYLEGCIWYRDKIYSVFSINKHNIRKCFDILWINFTQYPVSLTFPVENSSPAWKKYASAASGASDK